MSGARLEALGQVRNVYPYIVNTSVKVALAIPVASFSGEVEIPLDRSEIPFDLGPDKSSRVYITLNGYRFLITPDAGATTVLNGTFYYRNGGKRVYLASIVQTLATPLAYNSDLIITPASSIFAESINNIGYIGFENNASAAGTATLVNVNVYLNIGTYGDYSEPEWEKLFAGTMHEHMGPNDVISYLNAHHDDR